MPEKLSAIVGTGFAGRDATAMLSTMREPRSEPRQRASAATAVMNCTTKSAPYWLPPYILSCCQSPSPVN
jgi:hypothetical protein